MNRETLDFVVVDDLATLVWLANLAALELHTPQWQVGRAAACTAPDLLVRRPRPGPAGRARRVLPGRAAAARPRSRTTGSTPVAKTSGNKGMQLYAGDRGDRRPTTVNAYAHELAEELESAHPKLVVVADDEGAAAGQGVRRLEPEQRRRRRP